MADDAQLLRRYADEKSEEAFAALVQRHVDLVHSAALRQVNGDAHLAADITQLVFTDLARKAAALANHRVLAGWLFTSTRFAAAKAVRSEQRRRAREQEAHTMQELNHANGDASLDWTRVRPVLDDALGRLSERDREAILLRFFEGRDFAAVGAKLNVNPNTARMRVERALEKLHEVLAHRGIASTTAALGAALGAQAVAAAPAGLATSVAGAALAAGGAAAGGGAITALAVFMTTAKLQMGVAGAIVAAGATGLVVQENSNATLRAELDALQRQGEEVVQLRTENRRLAATTAEVAALRQDDVKLERLRDEAVALKARFAAEARAAARARLVAARADLALLLIRYAEGHPSVIAQRARLAALGDTLAGYESYAMSQLDVKPVPRTQGPPQYPVEFRNSGIGGEVIVSFVVDANGNAVGVEAIKSSRVEFEKSAVEAVSKWKFSPGQKSGLPVNTRVQVPIVFSLDDQSRNWF